MGLRLHFQIHGSIGLEGHIPCSRDFPVLLQSHGGGIVFTGSFRVDVQPYVIEEFLHHIRGLKGTPGAGVQLGTCVSRDIRLPVGFNDAVHRHLSVDLGIDDGVHCVRYHRGIIFMLCFRPQDDVPGLIRVGHHLHAHAGKTGFRNHVSGYVFCVYQVGKINLLLGLQQGSRLYINVAGPQHHAAAGVDSSRNINAGLVVGIGRPAVRQFHELALVVPAAVFGKVLLKVGH